MTVTSGVSAGTAASSSPVNGHVIGWTDVTWAGRSVPAYPRNTPNGSPAAPAV